MRKDDATDIMENCNLDEKRELLSFFLRYIKMNETTYCQETEKQY